MSYEGIEIEKRTLKTRILNSVPGAGVEPARIAPSVFETDASTDSAIRACIHIPFPLAVGIKCGLRLQSYVFFCFGANFWPLFFVCGVIFLASEVRLCHVFFVSLHRIPERDVWSLSLST